MSFLRYDLETGLFKLGGLLPEGMMFPFDFGFLPSTLGEDGDPIASPVLRFRIQKGHRSSNPLLKTSRLPVTWFIATTEGLDIITNPPPLFYQSLHPVRDLSFLPRQRNLWVTDGFEWRPEVRRGAG